MAATVTRDPDSVAPYEPCKGVSCGNILATSTPSNASSTSRNPDNLDHFAGSG
jgi:hypothetical protein